MGTNRSPWQEVEMPFPAANQQIDGRFNRRGGQACQIHRRQGVRMEGGGNLVAVEGVAVDCSSDR